MSDLLVYVNDNVSCSVITENFDVTVDNFRLETLEEQVSDVLPFNFKFTRLFDKQRIVIGLRQEAALKLSQCIQKVDDHFAVYLLGDKGNNSKASEPDINQVLTKEGDDDQVPARKKAQISRQPTLFDMCGPSTSTPRPTSSPYSAARARKVKIFSEQEIN